MVSRWSRPHPGPESETRLLSIEVFLHSALHLPHDRLQCSFSTSLPTPPPAPHLTLAVCEWGASAPAPNQPSASPTLVVGVCLGPSVPAFPVPHLSGWRSCTDAWEQSVMSPSLSSLCSLGGGCPSRVPGSWKRGMHVPADQEPHPTPPHPLALSSLRSRLHFQSS